MSIPIRQYDPGFINSVVHALTGAQIIYRLFNAWSTDPRCSVILWCRKGDAEWRANAIRVALSKERKAHDVPRTFELQFSEPWPYTHNGIKGEAIKISRNAGSMMTQMRAAMHVIAMREQEK